jgi:4-hydroxy-tetrahydrodipicolinate reductase
MHPKQSDSLATPRLVIYGVGRYGQEMVRLAVQKGWRIVAAYNRAGRKVDQDIGRLAGLNYDYGVAVEDCDEADYSSLDADVGIVTLYDRLAENFPAYKRLLSAGLNVVCHGTESYFPQAADPELARELDELAKANGVTFTGTGVWDMSRIWSALLIAGNCGKIKSLHNSSITNLSSFTRDIMVWSGVGMSPDEFYEKVARQGSAYSGLYKYAALLVLHALGYTVTNTKLRQEPIVLKEPFHCDTWGGEIPKGSCAGMSTVIEIETAEGVTATANYESRVFREKCG